MSNPSINPVKVLFKDREDFRAIHNGDEKAVAVVIVLYLVALAALFAVWLAADAALSIRIPVFVWAYFVIGWAQYSIGNGMHEAVHHNLNNKDSDLLASLMTAFPIGLTMSYRDVHLDHHQHLGTAEDPELDVYTSFPKSKLQMLLRFVWFLSGIPAVLQFAGQQSSAGAKTGLSTLAVFGAVQLLILLCFYAAFGNILYYVFFWAAPIATIGKLLASTRLLCEHGSPDHEWVVRTISGPRWQTWIMGAFDFNYHGEHHLFPSVPYAGLEELHRRHKAYAFSNPEYQPFGGRLEFFEGGYIRLITKWFRELPWK